MDNIEKDDLKPVGTEMRREDQNVESDRLPPAEAEEESEDDRGEGRP